MRRERSTGSDSSGWQTTTSTPTVSSACNSSAVSSRRHRSALAGLANFECSLRDLARARWRPPLGAAPAAFSLHFMGRVLLTGMSGTGKSSALIELGRLGFEVIDTDEPGWTQWSEREGGYVWRE